MKDAIHPKYFRTTVTCACGHRYELGTTRETMRVDICGHCHPFYTGKQRIVDTGGRVERFRRKYAKAKPAAAAGTESE